MIVLQPRDKHLLEELAIMRVIDREQAKIVAPFTSTTRANCRLLALARAGFLTRFFIGTESGGKKALYALSRRGSQCIGMPYRKLERPAESFLVADFFVQHQLKINAVFCAAKYGPLPAGITFARWISFQSPINPTSRLIPDGYFELQTQLGTLSAFLEVDLGTETLKVWQAKVRSYLQLAISGDAKQITGQDRFRVLVLVSSDRRLRSLQKATASLTDKLFWFSTFDATNAGGFFGPVWRRPANDQPVHLIAPTS